jgi:hypothetical protein
MATAIDLADQRREALESAVPLPELPYRRLDVNSTALAFGTDRTRPRALDVMSIQSEDVGKFLHKNVFAGVQVVRLKLFVYAPSDAINLLQSLDLTCL